MLTQYLCFMVAVIHHICFYLFLWFAHDIQLVRDKDLFTNKSSMARKWHVTKFRSDVRCVLRVSECVGLKG